MFVDPVTYQVTIGDYGMEGLKKLCRVFHEYSTLSTYSAPEVWQSLYTSEAKDSGTDDIGRS